MSEGAKNGNLRETKLKLWGAYADHPARYLGRGMGRSALLARHPMI